MSVQLAVVVEETMTIDGELWAQYSVFLDGVLIKKTHRNVQAEQTVADAEGRTLAQVLVEGEQALFEGESEIATTLPPGVLEPPPDSFKVTGLYVDGASGKFHVRYEDTPV